MRSLSLRGSWVAVKDSGCWAFEDKQSKFGVLPVLGTHGTTGSPEDINCTLCMQQGMFMGDLGLGRTMEDSSIASFDVTCAATSREANLNNYDFIQKGKPGKHRLNGEQGLQPNLGKGALGTEEGRDNWLRDQAPSRELPLPGGFPAGTGCSTSW